jgi:hypothetical protein
LKADDARAGILDGIDHHRSKAKLFGRRKNDKPKDTP